MPVLDEEEVARFPRHRVGLLDAIDQATREANFCNMGIAISKFTPQTREAIELIDRTTLRAVSNQADKFHSESRNLSRGEYRAIAELMAIFIGHMATPTGVNVVTDILSQSMPECEEFLRDYAKQCIDRYAAMRAERFKTTAPSDFCTAWENKVGKRISGTDFLARSGIGQIPASNDGAYRQKRLAHRMAISAKQLDEESFRILAELPANAGHATGSFYITMQKANKQNIHRYVDKDKYLIMCLNHALKEFKLLFQEMSEEDRRQAKLGRLSFDERLGSCLGHYLCYFNTLEGMKAGAELITKTMPPEISKSANEQYQEWLKIVGESWTKQFTGDIAVSPRDYDPSAYIPTGVIETDKLGGSYAVRL